MAVQIPATPVGRGLNEAMVLLKAVRRAGAELGLSDEETTQALDKSSTFFEQGHQGPMDLPTRQVIALVLRLDRSLSALVGNDITLMRHWMTTANRHTGGVPRQQLQDRGQLVKMVQYLDSMRGRP